MFIKARRYIGIVAVLAALALPASAAVLNIGGTGAISTNDEPYGSLGLLDGGEVATATFGLVVVPDLPGAILTLTVTNTSPAVLGTESPLIPDAPVISDIFFGVALAVENVTLLTVGGGPAATSGWTFSFTPDGEPSSGFGFLKSVFDVGTQGGPGETPIAPVIGSIYDPVLADEPGTPIASPLDFVFALTFEGGVYPTGFSGDWFCDPALLGYPDYLAAAKFMSGANGGSGTVTTPEPATLLLVALGASAAIAARRRKRAA